MSADKNGNIGRRDKHHHTGALLHSALSALSRARWICASPHGADPLTSIRLLVALFLLLRLRFDLAAPRDHHWLVWAAATAADVLDGRDDIVSGNTYHTDLRRY